MKKKHCSFQLGRNKIKFRGNQSVCTEKIHAIICFNIVQNLSIISLKEINS